MEQDRIISIPKFGNSLDCGILVTRVHHPSIELQSSEILSPSLDATVSSIYENLEQRQGNVNDLENTELLNEIGDYEDLINDMQTPPENIEQAISDQEIASKSKVLLKMLEDPNITTLPVLYVEEPLEESTENDFYSQPTDEDTFQKRSRYYRKYPGKRHNRNRSSYESDARYLCVPSREDVFKLLIRIHENRKGNHKRIIHFCNRKRPAKMIFKNIRFLG